MNLNVKPIIFLKGSIHLPASKSYSIRAYFIGGCAQKFTIKNASNCDDALIAQRLQPLLKKNAKVFNVGESGTSLRFLLPLLSFLNKPAIVQGVGTLIGRPNQHLCEALRRQGMDIQGTGPSESVPIVYKGGQLKGGVIKIDGSLSSQFISALLIAVPRLKIDSRIIITGKEMVSSDYIHMTRQILAHAGIKVSSSGARTLMVKGNQIFKPLRFQVPSDYGLAAFPLAASALLPSKVSLKGYFNDNFVQSDAHILTFLKKMGMRFSKTDEGIAVQGPFQLKGGTFSLKNCPDLVPIMCVLAMFAKGQTKLVDITHARVKESDRISDLRQELLKVGANIQETKDALIVNPVKDYISAQVLDPHNDHRLAMAFTVLGMKIGCTIKDIACTHKSYPGFVKDMKTLGM